MKKLIFLLLLFSYANLVSKDYNILGTIAFDTQEMAIDAGWNFDINNRFDIPGEIVIVKSWQNNGFTWLYAKSEGQMSYFQEKLYWSVNFPDGWHRVYPANEVGRFNY